MKLRIFSDPHVGVNRQANTSTSSRAEIADLASRTPSSLIQAGERGVCLGDVFDKYRVEPGAMLKAYNFLGNCEICLAGNHDTINDSEAVGSLQFLAGIMLSCRFVRADLGEACYGSWEESNTRIFYIPHVTSQALFEESLEKVYHAAELCETPHKFLLLHCNYDYPEGRLTSAELNLTKEDAEALIEDRDLTVLIGHMHTPATYLRGGLIVVGSTSNTGFADLSDKRSLLLDTETGELISETHWFRRSHVLNADWKALADGHLTLPQTGLEFLTLVGDVEPDEVFRLADLQRTCWDGYLDLLGLRDSTQLTTGELQAPSVEELQAAKTFDQFIRARMPDDSMKALFTEVVDHVA